MTKDGAIFLLLMVIIFIQFIALWGVSNDLKAYKEASITNNCAEYDSTTSKFKWINKNE